MPQSPAADTNGYAAKIPRVCVCLYGTVKLNCTYRHKFRYRVNDEEKHRGSETSGNRVNGSGSGPGHTDMSEVNNHRKIQFSRTDQG